MDGRGYIPLFSSQGPSETLGLVKEMDRFLQEAE
jgi:hypothetical protein